MPDPILVFVRMGSKSGEERSLSFPLPAQWKDFSQQMRQHGIAIDGNRGLLSINRTYTQNGDVNGFYGPFDTSGPSLSVVLAEVETKLELFLLSHALIVEFV